MNNNEEGAKKMLDYNNIPVGLSMALAQNTGALEHFAKMTDAERHSVINKARCVQTKHEMQDLAAGLSDNLKISEHHHSVFGYFYDKNTKNFLKKY